MVKLTEVEDEHFSEKPATTKDNALLADDDDDYTDTGTTLHLAQFEKCVARVILASFTSIRASR